MPSLLECLDEIESDVCVVTETWLRSDEKIEQAIEDFESQNGYSFIRRDRAGPKKGGGVAICYAKDRIQMSRVRLPHMKSELVAAIGRRAGQRRKVAIIGVYLPPAMRIQQVRRSLREVNDAVTHVKQKYNDPYIMLAGDFNRKDIQAALRDHVDIKPIVTGPTRGDSVLDIIATNMNDQLKEAGTTTAIKSEEGVYSDHLTVFATFRMPRVPDYRVEQYSYFHYTQEGNKRFGNWLAKQKWEGILLERDVHKKVSNLHDLFEKGTSESYEWKTRVKKTSEPVWMTDSIRDLIRKRRRLFRRIRRRDNWRTLKDKISGIVEERKKKNNERILQGFLRNSDSKNFHRTVRKLLGESPSPRWTPQSLYPDKSATETAEVLADFFNNISKEYPPLMPNEVPMSYDRQLPSLTHDEVAEALMRSKKTASQVKGDINPELYTLYPHQLSVPITDIFNRITTMGEWPTLWKTEFVTVIPKNPNPETVSECRNISCTNFLSKLYERFVLGWARQEVTPKLNQFGGEPNASTTMLLMKVIDYTLNAIEDHRAAVVLSAVDFSKAFNRLEHSACLKTFKRRGASTQILQLLATFLTGRSMTVRIDKVWSGPRTVNAGAPQGSVLGCYLFNIGVDDLEEGFSDDQIESEAVEHLTRTDDYPTASTPSRVGPPTDNIAMSPIGEPQEYVLLPRIANIPPWLKGKTEKKWTDKPIMSVKFVDDGINVETINMKEEPMMTEGGQCFKITKAAKTAGLLEHIRHASENKGMKVNEGKTGLMCVSTARSYQAKVKIDFNGQTIVGSDSLKILGVKMTKDCSFGEHINEIGKRLRRKTWALSKLRRKGMKVEDLVQAYKTTIRPTAEYASPAWHSSLTWAQSEKLERQQTQALKNIFGVGTSAAKMRDKANIERLWSRREEACLNFARKNIGNARCNDWFIPREQPRYARRTSAAYNTYKEPIYKTDRYRNSPINYAIRLLNRN